MPDDREDQIFSLRDENLALKKRLKANDDNTKKYLQIDEITKVIGDNEDIKEKQDADYISSLKEQIQALSTNSSQLKTKLNYYKTLHESEARKRTAYSHIPPRVETSKKTITEIESYNTEMEVQKETIQELQELTNKYRMKITSLDNEVKNKEQDILNLQETINEIKKGADIDRIALQQELNETKKLLIDQRAKNDVLDEQFRNVSKSFKEVTGTAEDLSKELNKEREKSLNLEKQLSEEKSKLEAQDEFQVIIQDLRKEKSLLEAELDKMMKNRFTTERDGEYQEEINNLKRILEEERNKYDALYQEKLNLQHSNADLLGNISLKPEQSSKDSLQRQKIEAEFYEKQNEVDELKLKLSQLTRTLEKQPTAAEMEEAFALLRLKKETGLTFEFLSNLHNFEKVICSYNKDNEAINELRQEYAACVLELEGANNLLKMQKKINDDLNKEMGEIKKKLQVITGEYEIRLAQQIDLLNTERNKVEYLEEKLRNSIPYDNIPHQSLDGLSGGNVIELVLHGAIYNSPILSYLNKSTDICTFEALTTIVLVDFYDFETSVTRIARGKFNLNVDEQFLYYFQTQKMAFTICQTDGIEFFVLGKCTPSFPSFHSGEPTSEKFSSDIFSLEKSKQLGKIEYTINCNVTLPKFTEYSENTISLNLKYPEYSKNINTSRADPNVLCIEVISASFISEVEAPVVTGIIHFPPTNREVVLPEIEGSTEPQFNFKTFLPVSMNSDLEKFLRTSKVTIAFADAKKQDHLYGTAKIPVIDLCNSFIDDHFDVENIYGIKCGSVYVKMKWESPYAFKINTVLDKERQVMEQSTANTPVLEKKDLNELDGKVVEPEIQVKQELQHKEEHRVQDKADEPKLPSKVTAPAIDKKVGTSQPQEQKADDDDSDLSSVQSVSVADAPDHLEEPPSVAPNFLSFNVNLSDFRCCIFNSILRTL
ncbi:X-linked retinitis pigmentosa GTPase regulator-interacting protein 1 [Boothiomyces macroporosus]|uniref:X-linked retinitis pigmentosa GTPase regulator-interacting protein 1 n=1 Tax=Boothiomyces macroporosus TaxID=261099 RepID=A0AAD5Y3D7_9FUNG|nr:X-linked retinitis pigmentosa GTPase regulator-interacting protein 1 [Boothiomyces macroporosus]